VAGSAARGNAALKAAADRKKRRRVGM